IFLVYGRMHYAYQLLAHLSIPHFSYEAALLLVYGFGRCGHRQIHSLLYVMELTDEYLPECLGMLIMVLVFFRIVAIWLLIRAVNPLENRRTRLTRISGFLKDLQRGGGRLLDGFSSQNASYSYD